MAKKPATLLRESIAAIKAVKALNFADWNDKDEDPQACRAFKKCDAVLSKRGQTESRLICRLRAADRPLRGSLRACETRLAPKILESPIMTTLKFLKACRDDAEPGEVTPLDWLHRAVESLKAPSTIIGLIEEDPDAFWMMVREVEGLYRNLKAALDAHDAALSPEAARLAEQLRRLDFSPEAMEAIEHLRQMGAKATNGRGLYHWECEE